MEYRLAALPGGIAGTDATVREIGRLIDYDLKAGPAVRFTATKILQGAGVAGKDVLSEAKALFQWVRSNVRYQKDPINIETVQGPVVTLRLRAGDCDDHAGLVSALAASVGIPARLRVVGYDSENVIHIFPELFAAGKWWPADTTEKKPFGSRPPRFPVERVYNLQGEVSMSMGQLPPTLPVSVGDVKAIIRGKVWEVLSNNWKNGLINDADVASYLAVIDGGNFPTKKAVIVEPTRQAIADFRSWAPANLGPATKPVGSLSGLEGLDGFLSSIWNGIKSAVSTVVKVGTGVVKGVVGAVTGSGGGSTTVVQVPGTPGVQVGPVTSTLPATTQPTEAGFGAMFSNPIVIGALIIGGVLLLSNRGR